MTTCQALPSSASAYTRNAGEGGAYPASITSTSCPENAGDERPSKGTHNPSDCAYRPDGDERAKRRHARGCCQLGQTTKVRRHESRLARCAVQATAIGVLAFTACVSRAHHQALPSGARCGHCRSTWG